MAKKAKTTTRFDFNDWINEDANDRTYQKIKDRYDYNPEKTKEIKAKVDNAKANDYDELNAIINLIRLWKINRLGNTNKNILDSLSGWVKNVKFEIDSETTGLERIKFKIDTADCEEDIRKLVETMLEDDGVGLPMASAILHFFNPEVFPVIDHRDYRSIYAIKHNERRELSNSKKPYMAPLYIEFIRECKDYCLNDKSNKAKMVDIDQYFYEIDRQIGNPVNFKDPYKHYRSEKGKGYSTKILK